MAAYSGLADEQVETKCLWYYQNNPSKPGSVWLLNLNSEHRAIGTAALSYRYFMVGKKMVTLGLAGNFAVDKNHRSLGPALMLQKALCSHVGRGVEAVYAFPPTAAAVLPMKRIGYEQVGTLVRYARVLNPINSLALRIRSKAIARVLSPLWTFVMRLMSKETWLRLPTDLRVCHFTQFDDRFDALWERGRFQFSVLGERSSSFLNWRYRQPGKICYVIGIVDKEDDLKAYLIYSHCDLNSIRIEDIFSSNIDMYFDLILAEFIKYMYVQNVTSISFEFFGSVAIKYRIHSFGFRKRPEEVSVCVYCDRGSPLMDMIRNVDMFFMTSADDNG